MAPTLRTVVVAGLIGLAAPLLVTTTASAAPTIPAATVQLASSSPAKHITVPASYVYNPKAKHQKTLHDYCSHSPDEFPIYGKNANFRGPCARHDMCIEYRQAAHRSTCDARLLANMDSECRYTYGWLDPRRPLCLDTAYVYWAVVRTKTAANLGNW